MVMLKDFTKWKCIDYCSFKKYCSDNYRKKFNYWAINNVFRDTFHIIQQIKQSNLVKNMNINCETLNCFLDATNIRNINGSYKLNNSNGKTLLGRIYCDKYKRGLKVTTVITDKNYLLDVIVSNGGAHDIKVVPHIYDNIKKNYKSNKRHRINIISDKGYISEPLTDKFNKLKMNYITPNKNYKKDKDKPKKKDHPLLKKRHLVENHFAHMKQNTRIRFVYDKLVRNYTAFLYLSILSNSQIT